jgi:alpha-1,3-rhamnosyl/mannosyltransferase
VLALAGSPFRGQHILDGVTTAAAAGIVDLGRLPDEDVAPLLGGATLFLYPSLAEGFGLPPLEAMACGTAVIAANTTSIPEAVAGAARLADPTPEAFAAAIAELLADDVRRADWVERGVRRVAHATWAHAAKQMSTLIEAGR